MRLRYWDELLDPPNKEGRMKETAAPPRDNLVRALLPGVELRAAEGDGDAGMPTMEGHFAVFNRWTEIDSFFEGNFMERIAPGAFKKTIRENRNAIKVTLEHGHDPSVGDKPLGPIQELGEDDTGGHYAVPLLDTSYNRDLIPALEAGLYGSSFRFQVIREQFDQEPEASEYNPKGIPERTLKEIRLYEFGPVTFPAYVEADAGLRSLTDRFAFEAIERDPGKYRSLLVAGNLVLTGAPEGGSAAEVVINGVATSTNSLGTVVVSQHPAPPERRTGEPEPEKATTPVRKPQTREEFLRWISEN